LSRAQTSVSVWPLAVCNNEEDRTICEEIHVICGEIIDRMSNILGNEDQDEAGNANDDDEPMDSSEDEVFDTPAAKARRAIDKQLEIINRSCSSNPIQPGKFVDMIVDGDSGSRQQCKDHALSRLYRGYETSPRHKKNSG